MKKDLEKEIAELNRLLQQGSIDPILHRYAIKELEANLSYFNRKISAFDAIDSANTKISVEMLRESLPF